MSDIKFEIGTKVYVVWNQCFSPAEVTITKIGRKYAETDSKRVKINIEFLSVGEGSTIGKVYLSKEEYQQQQELSKMWEDIRKKISNSYKKPESISKHDLVIILNILDAK